MRVTVSGNLGADVASVGANGTISANAVSVDGDFGVLTTPALSTAHEAWEAAVTVTNPRVKTGSTVVVSIQTYSGTPVTNGVPATFVAAVTDGAFTLRYGNIDGTNALNSLLKIAYRVYNA